MKNYYRYWGKYKKSEDNTTHHLLPYHSLDVAAVASLILKADGKLRERFSDAFSIKEESITSFLPFLICLHDIGKFSWTFQAQRVDSLAFVHHTALGLELFKKRAIDIIVNENIFPFGTSLGPREFSCGLQTYGAAVTGHHGLPPETDNLRNRFEKYFKDDDINSVSSFLRGSSKIFFPQNSKLEFYGDSLEDSAIKGSWLLAGFTVLCDWLGSNQKFFSFVEEKMELISYWEEYARPRAKEAIEFSGILPSRLGKTSSTAELFPEIKKANRMQNELEKFEIKNEPQLFILENITGSGKTEAAFALAQRVMSKGLAEGIYMALPTMATTNEIYKRIKNSYRGFFGDDEQPSLVLAHSAAELAKHFMHVDRKKEAIGSTDSGYDSMEERIEWLSDNRKKSLLADIGIGTIDQALMAVIKNRYQSLRLFGLVGKVLIVDEVHAYDRYMNRLLENLLRFHLEYGGTAILLSATLSQKTREKFLSIYSPEQERGGNRLDEVYPLLAVASAATVVKTPLFYEENNSRKIDVEYINLPEEAEKKIIDNASRGACCCWIRNTVSDAVESFKSLRKKVDKNNIILFHARFNLKDRLEIENRVLELFGKKSDFKKRKGMILIATQVVEQSLDLDFDCMVTDLAPIDLVIQRAGRLCRHTRDKDGNLKNGTPDERGRLTLFVYGPPFTENPDKEWFKKVFPKGAYVYPAHGENWLTAKLLIENGGWEMPDDARRLIEGVFGEDVEKPEALRNIDGKVLGEQMGEASLAGFNSLEFNEGYKAGFSWQTDDKFAPTRSNEKSVRVRLAKWDGEKLLPLACSDDYAWELSVLSIPARDIPEEPKPADPDISKALEELKKGFPNKSKYVPILPFVKDGDSFKSELLNDGKVATLKYSSIIGFTVS